MVTSPLECTPMVLPKGVAVLALALSAALTSLAGAQTASLKGKVVDSELGDPVPGAVVRVKPGGSILREVTVDKVFVPFRQEVHWSAGRRPGTTRVIVQARTEDGTVGVGETICLLEFIEPVLSRTVIPLALGMVLLGICGCKAYKER